MKKISLAVALFLTFGLLNVGMAKADAVFTIEVEWAFTAPDDSTKTVLGYKLYKEGSPAITWDGATRSVGTVVLMLPESSVTHFTLTALYSDNTESPQSPSYPFQPNNSTAPSISEVILIKSMLGKSLPPGTEIKKGKLGE